MTRKHMLIALLASLLCLVIYFDVQASSQGCGISEFTMDPTDPYIVGDHVFLSGKSNCGTVRFEINGEPKSETGQPNQSMTWNTEESGSGNFDVCFVARGEGGWENAARDCRHVYVEGGQAPPSGSENTGGPVKCWINAFNVNPASVKQGDKFHLAGQGQCDGNARASRFSVDGNPFSEFGGYQTSENLGTGDLSIGSHQLCFHITGGDWADEASSCIWVEVSNEETNNNDVVEGDQTENDVQGQTEESDPNGDSQQQSGSDNGNSCAGSALSLSIGDSAQVNLGDKSNNLRRNPHLSSSWIGKIPGGDQFTVIGGPTCADGFWWWEVNYQGQNGWTAQGDGSDIWIGGLGQPDSLDSDEPENIESDGQINPQPDIESEPPLAQEGVEDLQTPNQELGEDNYPPILHGGNEAPPNELDTYNVVISNPIGEHMMQVCIETNPNFWERVIQISTGAIPLITNAPNICTLVNSNEMISYIKSCFGDNIDSVFRGEGELKISFGGLKECLANGNTGVDIGKLWNYLFR